MGHDSNVLRKTGNLHHRVGCMLCGDLADQQTDDEEDGSECCANNKEGGWLWMCSWCALRICGECKFMLREEEKAISTPTSGEEPVPTGKKGVDLKALRSKVLEERALPKEQRKKRPSESALEKATGVEEHTQTPDVTQDSDGGHDITRRKALPLPEEEDVESHHSVVYITASTTPIPHEPRLNQEGSKEQGLEQAKLEHHLKATAPPMATRSRDSGVAIRGQSEESVYQGDEVDTGSTYVELDASDSLVMKSRTAPVKLNEIKPNKNSNESRSLEEEESLVKTETEAPVMRGPASFPPRGSSRAPVNATEENDREVVVLTASTPPKVDIPPRTEQPIVSVAVTPPPLPLKVEHPPRFDSRNATTVSAPVIETKPEVKQTERQNAATDSDRESTYDYDLSALLSSSMAALQNLHPRPAEKPVPIAKDVPSTPSRLTTINTTTVNPVLSTASPVSPIRKKPVPAASTPPSSPPVPPKVPANTSTSKSPATNTNMSPVGYSPSSLVKRKPVHPFLKSNSGDVTQKQHRGSGSFGSLGSLASFSIDRVKSNESHSSTGFSGLGFGRSEKKSNAVVVENKPAPFLLPPLEFEKMSTNMDIGVSAGLTTNGLFGDGGALGLEPPGSPRSNGFTPSINNGPQYYSPVGQLMGLGDYNGARAGNINGGNNQMDKSKRWLKGLFGKSLS